MACGLLAKMAVTAVLLGGPSLKIQNYDQSSIVKYCSAREPVNANATVVLRDAKGAEVLKSRIYLPQFDFYFSGLQRGGVPEKSVSFLYTYPVTAQTARASKVELQIDGHSFRQSAELQNVIVGMK